MLLLAPFPGGSAVPIRIKAALAMLLTLCLFPTYGMKASVLSVASLTVVVLNQMAVGALLGLSLTFVFDAAQLAGQIMGMQVGFSLVNIIDPQTQVDTPVLSTMHQMLVLLIFLRLDVHHWVIRGTASSFSYLPIGELRVSGSALEALLHGASSIFVSGVEIAAPILCATLLADVGLGFVGKASPQLQVLFLGMSVKTVLALLVWMSALALWPNQFELYFGRAMASSEQLLHLAR